MDASGVESSASPMKANRSAAALRLDNRKFTGAQIARQDDRAVTAGRQTGDEIDRARVRVLESVQR
jgi:hypothetical protein